MLAALAASIALSRTTSRSLPIRGYAAPHALTLDLGAGGDRAVLLLTGWTDYAFSSDNVAGVAAAASRLTPPSLQVKDASGRWRTVDRGHRHSRRPAADRRRRSRAASSCPASREVRIVTNMRIYWDQILVGDVRCRRADARMTRLDPTAADLRWRGFSAETTPDGREPYGYDYERVSTPIRRGS